MNSFSISYYGMDRDKRYERVKIAYDMLCKGEGEKISANGIIEVSVTILDRKRRLFNLSIYRQSKVVMLLKKQMNS